MERCILSYNGERQDPVSGAFHLGKGYRAYSPQLMRFTHPDNLSPFGAGGFNPYAYCTGDPVNRADPTGHFSWQAGLGIGLGVLGILGTILTGGTALIAAGSLSAALDSAEMMSLISASAGIMADASGIANTFTAGQHRQVSSLLGWLSFAWGIVSGVSTLSLPMLMAREPLINSANVPDTFNLRPLFPSGLSYTIEDGRQINSISFLFDDTYKGGKRLNLLAHGVFNHHEKFAWIRSREGAAFTGVNFAKFIRDEKNVDFKAYQYARLLMCHSAAGGEQSFAAGFARISGIPTKAFKGTVTIESMMDLCVSFTDAANTTDGHAWSIERVNREIETLVSQGSQRLMVEKNSEQYRYSPAWFDATGHLLQGSFKRL